jgi:hypothetical protein
MNINHNLLTFSSPDRQSVVIRANIPGDYQVMEAWPQDIPPPKAPGAPPRTSRRAFIGTPGVIYLQNTIRFQGEMIFLENLSLPVIVLGDFARRHDFLLE